MLTELLALAREEGVDLIGEPRLVRLNPNIPWKTRGNAALCARFGTGRGSRRRVGEANGRPFWSFANEGPLPHSVSGRFLERAWERVLLSSRRGEPKTDPALVAVEKKFPARVYYRTVREIVEIEETRSYLDKVGAFARAEGDGRGLIGATAAIAWPGRRATWELIAYRPVEREGARRQVDPASVRKTAERHRSLFLCHDPRTRRLLVSPHTPCPILFGLRGRDREAPLRARGEVRSEPVDRWVLFRTNQGTGDHLVDRRVRELVPFGSGRVFGDVVARPTTLRGGHVRVRIEDLDGTPLEAIAFEPTKTLPRIVRSLVPGDRVELWGSRGADPVMKMEGLRVLSLVPRWTVVSAPICPACQRSARSLGTVRGFRCPRCRRTFPPEAARRQPRVASIRPGEYHPTPSARRHLAPLGPEP